MVIISTDHFPRQMYSLSPDASDFVYHCVFSLEVSRWSVVGPCTLKGVWKNTGGARIRGNCTRRIFFLKGDPKYRVLMIYNADLNLTVFESFSRDEHKAITVMERLARKRTIPSWLEDGRVDTDVRKLVHPLTGN